MTTEEARITLLLSTLHFEATSNAWRAQPKCSCHGAASLHQQDRGDELGEEGRVLRSAPQLPATEGLTVHMTAWTLVGLERGQQWEGA